MGEKVCIECGNPVYGKKAVRVKDDLILKMIRSIKRATKTAKENELYVCESDLPKNQQKRKEFMKHILIFSFVAAIVFFLSLLSFFLSSNYNVGAVFFGIVVAVVILLLAIIMKYTPGVESEEFILIEQKPTESKITASPPAPPESEEKQPLATAVEKKTKRRIKNNK